MSILKTHQTIEQKVLSTFWSSLKEIQSDNSNLQSKENFDGLLHALMTLTTQGNAQAQYYLARYLKFQDSPVTLLKLTEAADNNYPNACSDLAKHYVEVKDFNLAEKYFLKLFASGDSYLIDDMNQLLSNDILSQMPKLDVAINGVEPATVADNRFGVYATLLNNGSSSLMFNNRSSVSSNELVDEASPVFCK